MGYGRNHVDKPVERLPAVEQIIVLVVVPDPSKCSESAGVINARCIHAQGDARENFLSPAATRAVREKSYSQRRACRLVGLHPKLYASNGLTMKSRASGWSWRRSDGCSAIGVPV